MTLRLPLLFGIFLFGSFSAKRLPRKSTGWHPPKSFFSKVLRDLKAIKRVGLRLEKEHRGIKESLDDIKRTVGDKGESEEVRKEKGRGHGGKRGGAKCKSGKECKFSSDCQGPDVDPLENQT